MTTRHSITLGRAASLEDVMKLRLQCLKLAARAVILPIVSATLVAWMDHGAAWSQTNRTIKIIVPYAPGGGTDLVARALAEQVGQMQGATVVIENRAGAGSVIGTEAAARAVPDGN